MIVPEKKIRRIHNPILERIISDQRLVEILAAMTPRELLIALLRAERLTNDQIAAQLHTSPSTVRHVLARLRRRIRRAHPELRATLAGRARPPGFLPAPPPDPHLDLAGLPPDAALTVNQVAAILHVSPTTIRNWCHAGKFPAAHQDRTHHLAPWSIPVHDLQTFTPPPPAPPLDGRGLPTFDGRRSPDRAPFGKPKHPRPTTPDFRKNETTPQTRNPTS